MRARSAPNQRMPRTIQVGNPRSSLGVDPSPRVLFQPECPPSRPTGSTQAHGTGRGLRLYYRRVKSHPRTSSDKARGPRSPYPPRARSMPPRHRSPSPKPPCTSVAPALRRLLSPFVLRTRLSVHHTQRICPQPDANPPAIAAEHGRGARAGLPTRCPARPPLASAYPPPHAPPSPCFASRHALRAAYCAIRGPQPPNAPLRPVAGLNRGSAPASEPTGAARAAALPALAALGPSRRSVGRFPPRLSRVWARVGWGGALRGLGAG